MIELKIPDFTEKTVFVDYDDIPDNGGVYVFYNQEKPVYVGKCKNLRVRIYEHKLGITNTRRVYSTFETVKYFVESCPMSRDIYETYLINTMQPIFNTSKCFNHKPKYVQLPHISKKKRYERMEAKANRCQHFKNDGTQCKNYISENGYCGVHKKKYLKSS